MARVVIIMGSRSDLEHCKKISKTLGEFNIDHQMRVASAHKVPLKVLDILKEQTDPATVLITVAGRSNALSGFTDAQTTFPVIACPPYSDKFAGADIWSSVRMPSGVCPLTVLEPKLAALAAVKILTLSEPSLKEKLEQYRKSLQEDLYKADEEVKNG